ncbi:hypothetical protein M501DRAFT_921053, partial [Patellaria atrata CBS 101060]
EPINENSPLLEPRASEQTEVSDIASPGTLDEEDWNVDTKEETKSVWYLILLTITGGGLQISWSVETSNFSPYLLSLGLSKSLLALVWIAGPLSGVLVQPYVGLRSDNSRSRFGKRRPFIIGGAAATIVSLMMLAWAREIVGGFLSMFGVDPQSNGTRVSIIVFASAFVYILDFAINVIQAAIRAFVVDCAPTHQQEAANAWILRSGGAGNIVAYMFGSVNLPKMLPFLGDSQFKGLCAIASLALVLTVSVSCGSIGERDARFEPPPENTGTGLISFFTGLFRSMRRLPPQIKKVCQVQFFAWMGWFPFLFYITTYCGEIYADPLFEENPNMSESEIDAVFEKATRIATRALLIFAITTFTASIVLPFVIQPTYEAPQEVTPTPLTPTSSGLLPSKSSKLSSSQRTSRLLSLFPSFRISSLTLRRAWLLSHIFFAFLMFMTFFVSSVPAATALIALIGLPWALTGWAPFALISSEISKRDAIRRGLLRAPPTRDGQLLADGVTEAEDQAGVVLGIHNVAVAAPQAVATLVASVIFKFTQLPRGAPGDNSVAWVLRFGGLSALVAAYLTTKVAEERKD